MAEGKAATIAQITSVCLHLRNIQQQLTNTGQRKMTKYDIKVGDAFTIGNIYKRRTFWQWLKREKKQLQQHKVVYSTRGK